MKYEKCPKCGKKGLRELRQDPIHMMITYRTTDVKECKYCGYYIKDNTWNTDDKKLTAVDVFQLNGKCE